MKKILIIFFAFLTVVNCSSSQEVIDKIKSTYLRKIITQKKDNIESGFESLEKDCPGVKAKYKAALISFSECVGQSDNSLTICKAIQTYTLNCTRPLLKVIDECLADEAEGVPILGVKSFLSVAEFLCKQSGESMFELVNPCLWKGNENSSKLDDECNEKLIEINTKYGNEIPNKSEVCNAAINLKSCVLSFSAQCKNQRTKDIFVGFFDAAVAPCKQIDKLY